MSTCTIRSAIAAVGDYYRSPETKTRAQDLVNNLTSGERESILQIIKESNKPIPTPYQLSKKLREIHTQDNNNNFSPLTSKDEELSSVQIFLLNIWRVVKDIFGFRISDKKMLSKIEDYSIRSEVLSDTRADIPELLFSSSESLELLLAAARKTTLFDVEIIPVTEYQSLGLIYTQTCFTLEELESAYRMTLKKHSKDPMRLDAAKKGFQITYALENIKNELIADQSNPLTLKAASESYRKFSDSQKKKLTFLIKYYTIYSLFQNDLNT